MRHGSLFSGIGGFDLAAQWMGWENVFHCEIDEWSRHVLNKHFPNSISYEDIKTTDFTIHRGSIEILSGGFPCQPYSKAGKRKGKDDERHLWPEMLRAIREISPQWIVGENVYGIIDWGGGVVFDEVQVDLEIEGYEVIPVLLPASGIGALHERKRVWFIAYANGYGFHPPSIQGRTINKLQLQPIQKLPTRSSLEIHNRRSEPGKYGVVDGIPATLDERRIKALGNAIVPQVAYEIFKAIEQFDLINNG